MSSPSESREAHFQEDARREASSTLPLFWGRCLAGKEAGELYLAVPLSAFEADLGEAAPSEPLINEADPKLEDFFLLADGRRHPLLFSKWKKGKHLRREAELTAEEEESLTHYPLKQLWTEVYRLQRRAREENSQPIDKKQRLKQAKKPRQSQKQEQKQRKSCWRQFSKKEQDSLHQLDALIRKAIEIRRRKEEANGKRGCH